MRRSSNSLRSLATALATDGSLARASNSGGKVMDSAPSRSASRRALRAASSSRPLVTMARLARVTVSSSCTRMSPALTRSPSCTLSLPTTPPVGCCTFLTLESTTMEPCAMSAPAIWVVEAQPPTPKASTSTITPPAIRCLRMDSRALPDGPAGATARPMRRCARSCLRRSTILSCAATPAAGTTLSGCGAARGRCRTLDRISSFGPMACALP